MSLLCKQGNINAQSVLLMLAADRGNTIGGHVSSLTIYAALSPFLPVPYVLEHFHPSEGAVFCHFVYIVWRLGDMLKLIVASGGVKYVSV